MSSLYQDATSLPEYITPVYVDTTFPSSTVPPVFKIPLHIPSFSSVSSPMTKKSSVVSPSSLKTTTLQVSSTETSILDISSAPEVILAQNVTSSPSTSPITITIPSHTTTQTSSLISTGISIPPIDDMTDEFNEDFVISLREYQYSKVDRSVVKKGKKRNRDQSDMDISVTNEVLWTQRSSDP